MRRGTKNKGNLSLGKGSYRANSASCTIAPAACASWLAARAASSGRGPYWGEKPAIGIAFDPWIPLPDLASMIFEVIRLPHAVKALQVPTARQKRSAGMEMEHVVFSRRLFEKGQHLRSIPGVLRLFRSVDVQAIVRRNPSMVVRPASRRRLDADLPQPQNRISSLIGRFGHAMKNFHLPVLFFCPSVPFQAA